MKEIKLFLEFAPYFIPFLGAICLIIFTRKYLFSGLISSEMYQNGLERERSLVVVQEEIAMRLSEIVDRLEAIKIEAIKIERRSGDERRKSYVPDQPGNLE
jgi:hypothetical protein